MSLLKPTAAVMLALAVLAGPAHAELVATPLPGDVRLVQFQFDEDNSYLILTKPKAITHLRFAPDEKFLSVFAGDTSQWEITPTKSGANIFIKPKFEGVETSMTVVTSKRNYQFVLRSTGDGKKWYQRVSWLYSSSIVLEEDAQLEVRTPSMPVSGPMAMPLPDPSLANSGIRPIQAAPTLPGFAPNQGAPAGVAEGVRPEKLRFTYKIDGEAAFKPTQVFDDGKFTYFKLPQDLQDMPALFALLEDEEYALVNYVIKGDYMVAQRLIESAVLVLGKTKVRVDRIKPAPPGFFSGMFGKKNND